MSSPWDWWHRDVVMQFLNLFLAATLLAKELLLGSLMCKTDKSEVTLARGLGARRELDPALS